MSLIKTKGHKMHFNDIEKFPTIYYQVNTPWDYVEDQLNRYINKYGLNMNPDFQREHVWTEDQQIKYVEFMLKGPESGKDIYFNHPGWMSTFEGEMLLLDGKQRLEAYRRFKNNEIKVYNHYLKDFEGRIPSSSEFIFKVMKLKTKEDIIKWYINFNSGGTPHTDEEIERVKKLIIS